MDERTEFESRDISFNTGGKWSFGYRAGAAIVRNNCLLLQSPAGVDEFAIPGGQVQFGEAAADTLRRELPEEIGVEYEVGEFQAAGEVFFPVGDKTVHQIFLQFAATLPDGVCTEQEFYGIELKHGKPKLRFRWVLLDRLRDIPLYPPQVADVLLDGVRHYVYVE